MNLIILSGLSGSGKTIALHTLEDIGFYCIDNLPIGLLEDFAGEVSGEQLVTGDKVAVSIDARNHPQQLNRFPSIIEALKKRSAECRIIYLQARDATLLQRFSETRRKHPLSGNGWPLADAIREERSLLAPIAASADMLFDTSETNLYQLRDLLREYLGEEDAVFSLQLRSFGFKHGIPADADFVFDTRCLPNPHWQESLRNQTGLDADVIGYLDGEPLVQEMYNDLNDFLARWVPRFKADKRSYLSIAIGCTGGQHRSVYLADRLAKNLGTEDGDIVVRHRELE